MKKFKNIESKSFFKKKFVQLCRIFGYELLDQNSFEIPILNTKINNDLSILGKKSITIPLGEIKITRKIKSLSIYLRTCSEVTLWDQNKDRVFKEKKSEYSLRCLNSILKSINFFKDKFNSLDIQLIIIDDNSNEFFLKKISNLISNSKIKSEIIHLDKNEYKNEVKDTNFASVLKSYYHAKSNAKDLIYFVEDDYIHKKISINEMLLTYERISSQLNKEIIIFPVDYPFLYANHTPTYILLGNSYHWRKTDQSLGTLMISKDKFTEYWDNFYEFATVVQDPYEKPLHEVYEIEYCFSPIPSLAIHCTNINSIYGLSPNVEWEKVWNENKLE